MKFYLSYYGATILFSLICAFIALCIGFKLKNKFNELNIFYFYPLASISQSTISIIANLNRNHSNRNICLSINNAAANIFLLVEFLLMYNFFKKVFLSKSAKQFMQAISVVYLIILFADWICCKGFFNWSPYIFVAQALLILGPALYYFLELFKKPVISDPLNTYSFWISLGTVIYFSCTLPIFLFIDIAYNKKGMLTEANLYSINNICYGIFFLSITKAYLCPKTIS
jgi:hypothetical protein